MDIWNHHDVQIFITTGDKGVVKPELNLVTSYQSVDNDVLS